MLPDCFDCKYGGLEHPCRSPDGAFDFAKVAAGIIAIGRAGQVAIETGSDIVIDEAIDWVTDCEFETIEDHPRLLLPLIAAAMDACETGGDAGFIAAGLLENALVKHGLQIIGEIEALAASSRKARYILSGVWTQNGSINPEVWSRLASAIAAGPVMSVDEPNNAGFGLPPERVADRAEVTALFAAKLMA